MIGSELLRLAPTLVIHGGARGADTIAGGVAKRLGIPVTVYHADWNLYGGAAGPKRNQRMLEEGKPDKVIAFWNGESRGTADMIARARHYGVPVDIVMTPNRHSYVEAVPSQLLG